MKQREISKSLDSIIAQATFRANQLGATQNYMEILLLELILRRDSLSYQLLSAHLTPQQMQHIETQIHRISESSNEVASNISAEEFFSELTDSIIERYTGGDNNSRLTTLHALHYILSDHTTPASRMMKMYGVSDSVIEFEISQFSPDNIIHPMMGRALHHNATPIKSDDSTTSLDHQSKSDPLSKFGVDLVEVARSEKQEPIIGRKEETQRVVEILSRRKKNNPLLVGEAGVGKSAIVEGLAQRIASGDVPHTLQGKRLYSIDIAALVAGTKFRGDFEQRIQELLTALKESSDTILFIDEIHTIVGAGSTQGSLDAANILKPALARGDIQTIGATTFDEYRRHIEADSALERRFQRVTVEPTSIEESIEILQNISPNYEEHHRVIYSQEALEACVKLSARYIPNRHLPDKAIDLMDEAGARSAIKRGKQPTLILSRDIEAIVTLSTGIDVTTISSNEMERLRNIERDLNGKVIGQNHAVEKLSRTIRRSRIGLSAPDRPLGVFMFVGQTGVGKTHLAKELTRWMFGTKRSLIRLDMSEYSESHNASRLIGSPPGYVGYGEGGELSEAVRRNPYSVVLLDEIEKAHPDIYNVMLQIFDEGELTDGSGRKIDFRNTIIIMTSNVGSRNVVERAKSVGYATASKIEKESSANSDIYRKALERRFSPEFLNRIDDILHFNPLSDGDLEEIVKLELKQLFQRLNALGYQARITPSARRELAKSGDNTKYGARALRRRLLERVEEPVSDMIVEGALKSGETIVIELKQGDLRVRCG